MKNLILGISFAGLLIVALYPVPQASADLEVAVDGTGPCVCTGLTDNDPEDDCKGDRPTAGVACAGVLEGVGTATRGSVAVLGTGISDNDPEHHCGCP